MATTEGPGIFMNIGEFDHMKSDRLNIRILQRHDLVLLAIGITFICFILEHCIRRKVLLLVVTKNLELVFTLSGLSDILIRNKSLKCLRKEIFFEYADSVLGIYNLVSRVIIS